MATFYELYLRLICCAKRYEVGFLFWIVYLSVNFPYKLFHQMANKNKQIR